MFVDRKAKRIYNLGGKVMHSEYDMTYELMSSPSLSLCMLMCACVMAQRTSREDKISKQSFCYLIFQLYYIRGALLILTSILLITEV